MRGVERAVVTLALCWAVSARVGAQPGPPPTTLDQAVKRFAREVALARKDGLPLSVADMKRPLPPADRNAAAYYAKLPEVRMVEWDPIEVLYTTFAPTQEQIEKARGLIAAHRSDLALVHKAVDCPEYVPLRDWSKWPVDWPIGQERQAVRWLTAEAALQWFDGHTDEAIRTQALGFVAARQVGSDRCLLSFLVATALDAITRKGLGLMLLRGGDRPGVAASIEAVLERNRAAPNLTEALRGELASSLCNLAVDADSPGDDYIRRGWKFGPLMDHPLPSAKDLTSKQRREWRTVLAIASINVALWRETVPTLDLPYPRAHAEIRALLARWKRARSKTEPDWADLFCPMFLQAKGKATLAEAETACQRAGAAVVAWKVQHGTLPNGLDEVLSPVPTDPFSLKALRYRKEGDGFVVWSVGESGKFDGGSPTVRPNVQSPHFRWPRPVYIK